MGYGDTLAITLAGRGIHSIELEGGHRALEGGGGGGGGSIGTERGWVGWSCLLSQLHFAFTVFLNSTPYSLLRASGIHTIPFATSFCRFFFAFGSGFWLLWERLFLTFDSAAFLSFFCIEEFLVFLHPELGVMGGGCHFNVARIWGLGVVGFGLTWALGWSDRLFFLAYFPSWKSAIAAGNSFSSREQRARESMGAESFPSRELSERGTYIC